MTQPTIDFTKFRSSVEKSLIGSVVGYAGVVGSSTGSVPLKFQYGQAITSANGPQSNFLTSTQFAIASVSKFLTAIAAVQLLEGTSSNTLDVHLDIPISEGALPDGWNIRPDALKITYRDLLTHRSGIAPAGSTGEPGQDYFSLKTYMTQDTVKLQSPVPPKRTAYSNVGFALFRLMPKIAGLVHDDLTWPEQDRAYAFAAAYEQIILENVFGPVKVVGPGTKTPSTGGHAFSYYYPGDTSGYDWSHWQYPGQVWPGQGQPLWAGAGCWWLSIDQLMPVLDSINRGDGKILSSSQWLHMQGLYAPESPPIPPGYEELGLGIDLFVDPTNSNYRWVEKNGSGPGGDNTGGGTFSSSIAFFGVLEEAGINTPGSGYYAALSRTALAPRATGTGAASAARWPPTRTKACARPRDRQRVRILRADSISSALAGSPVGRPIGGSVRSAVHCAMNHLQLTQASALSTVAGTYARARPSFWIRQVLATCNTKPTGDGARTVVCWRTRGETRARACALTGGSHEFILSGSNYSIKFLVGADTVLLQAFHDSIV
jgi:hypothetical protein